MGAAASYSFEGDQLSLAVRMPSPGFALPAGSAIVVDDFQEAAAGVARNMTDLVERWPAETAQLVLASRVDPPLRLHRLRLSGELCEVRHFLAAREAGRALALLHDRVITDFLHDPVVPAALDLSTVDPSRLAGAPDRLLALAADLLLWG